jgi:hypothetical protein
MKKLFLSAFLLTTFAVQASHQNKIVCIGNAPLEKIIIVQKIKDGKILSETGTLRSSTFFRDANEDVTISLTKKPSGMIFSETKFLAGFKDEFDGEIKGLNMTFSKNTLKAEVTDWYGKVLSKQKLDCI